MAAITCDWPVSDTQTLAFEVYGDNEEWNDVPGVYLFCCLKSNYWEALYVGQTDSFSDQLTNHERHGEAARDGATHIHVLVERSKAKRDQIERSLIQYLQPPMNDYCP